jgi:ubiquinone biosynthesis protein
MVHGLSQLAHALDIPRFIPDAYAAYRPLIADGVSFFLDNLPRIRVAEILSEQLALPSGASPAERLIAMLRCCPTLHKFGQVVSRDRRLAPDLRRQLQRLESLPSRHTEEVWSELPQSPELEIAPQPLAEASVAIVIPFAWRSHGTPPQDGVFKVLKPGVADRLGQELEIWPALGTFLEERCLEHGLPQIPYRETLERVRRLLQSEVRLDHEQAHLSDAARFYVDTPDVVIPRILPFCTPRITAMERVHGCKVTDAALTPDGARALAETIVEALVARPFWNNAPVTPFHADPHAGNLLRTSSGQLAILDWSLVGRLRKTDQIQLMQVMLAALSLDPTKMAVAISALSRTPVNEQALRSIVTDALRRIRHGAFPGFQWLLRLLDALAASATVEFSEDLLFFRKALLSIGDVVQDVCGECTLDSMLLDAGARTFCRELASRFLTSVDSRSLQTHVSNADLCRLWASWPMTAARFWAGLWQDTVESARPGR